MAPMPARRRLLALPAALALGAVALPATAAHAATIDPLKACYVSVNPAETQFMHIVGRGFEPSAPVQIRIDDQAPVTVEANAAGTVRAKPAAPPQDKGERIVTITLTDATNPADTVTAITKVTALSVQVHPKKAATYSRVRFAGRGFTQHRSIWGHYVYRGRERRTVRLATLPVGDCGTLSVRRRLIPIRHPRAGRWTLQIDQQRRWATQPHSVLVPVPITVEQVIGTR